MNAEHSGVLLGQHFAQHLGDRLGRLGSSVGGGTGDDGYGRDGPRRGLSRHDNDRHRSGGADPLAFLTVRDRLANYGDSMGNPNRLYFTRLRVHSYPCRFASGSLTMPMTRAFW